MNSLVNFLKIMLPPQNSMHNPFNIEKNTHTEKQVAKDKIASSPKILNQFYFPKNDFINSIT